MIDLSDVESIRSALVKLCGNPVSRITGRAQDVRNYWEPMTVREPDTQMFFTDEGAWDFIADSLQSGAAIKYKEPTSEFPDHAYYFIDAGTGDKPIYMKIALRAELKKVVGISFHYSEPKTK